MDIWLVGDNMSDDLIGIKMKNESFSLIKTKKRNRQ